MLPNLEEIKNTYERWSLRVEQKMQIFFEKDKDDIGGFIFGRDLIPN
jgi:hypothetical protein